MAENLIDLTKDVLSGDLLSALSGALGEKKETTEGALGGAISSIVGGLMSQASNDDGLSGLASMLDDDHSGGILDNIGDLFSADNKAATLEQGNGILSGLLGDKLGAVIGAVSSAAGMGRGSTGSLFGMLAPIVMGVLGRKKSAMGWGAAQLGKFLLSQAPFVKKSAPGNIFNSLGLAGLGDKMGDAAGKTVDAGKHAVGATVDTGKKAVSGTVDAGKHVVGGAANATRDAASAGGGMLKRLLPLLALVVLGIIAWPFLKGCGADAVDMTGDVVEGTGDMIGDAAGAVGDVAEGAVDVTGDVVDGIGDAVGGVFDFAKGATASALGILDGSVGANFIDYLKSAREGESFTLDEVKFATGSANLDASSQNQLDDIVKILGEYSSVNVELGGHTDNTGNADANTSLSQSRADAVMAYLVNAGVDGSRLTAKGYGQAEPMADNATAEGRRQNRRTDMKVTKK